MNDNGQNMEHDVVIRRLIAATANRFNSNLIADGWLAGWSAIIVVVVRCRNYQIMPETWILNFELRYYGGIIRKSKFLFLNL